MMEQWGALLQLGAFGLLSGVIIWSLMKGIPMVLAHIEKIIVMLKQWAEDARIKHHEDSEAMRVFMAVELERNRECVQKLTSATERNTIALIAHLSNQDVEAAVNQFTNGGNQ